MELYGLALQTALVLALPVVAAVAVLGVAVALVQTVVGIQDQNVSFGPKIIAVALLAGFGGLPPYTEGSFGDLIRANSTGTASATDPPLS